MSEHAKRFEADVGTWDGEMEVRPQPESEPMRSRGVMTNRLVGTWLVSDFENETGFRGTGIYGWDEAKQAYVATWIDSMRPWLVVGTGVDDGTRITYSFEQPLGDAPMTWQDRHEVVDGDTRRFATTMGGHEVVRAIYRRRR